MLILAMAFCPVTSFGGKVTSIIYVLIRFSYAYRTIEV